jgi:gamma-glutamylcyclotransferase (GGCT)/AIG2-like uncharacterized protein YtfP
VVVGVGRAVNVFTYGSLMYPQVWDRVVRGRYRSADARLAGFRRRALADATYPAAVPEEGASIHGRIYFDVGADDLARLDAFEAAEYRRDEVEVRVDTREGPVHARAQVYVYLVASRLAPGDWDVHGFEREHLADFAQRHGARAASSG